MDPNVVKEGLSDALGKLQEGSLDYGRIARNYDALMDVVFLQGAAWAFEAHAEEWEEVLRKMGSNIDPERMLAYVRSLPLKLRAKAEEMKAEAVRKSGEVAA